ncbi:MAG TPA: LCP family protein [Acidimicrobiia bacterium]|nr:LCP family protein [Acidimicrobiia bacterium]
MRTFGGRFVIALVLSAVVTTAAVASVNHEINTRVTKIRRVHLLVAQPPPAGENFLIIGSDSRQFVDNPTDEAAFGDPSVQTEKNSDTLMVAHVEPAAKRSLIVSFPRDLIVDINGLGRSKINAAYSYGGPQAVIDMLKDNFDIDIHHYVEVDFKSFQDIVDAIGNVSVFFPFATRDDQTGLDEPAGCQSLDGGTALQYVRMRYVQEFIDGKWVYADQDAPDLHRIARQQAFIRKLAGLAIDKSLSDPFLAFEIADKVLGDIKADQNLQRSDVNQLIEAFRTVDVNDPNSVQFQTLPVAADPSNPESSLVLGDGAQQVIDQLRTFGNNQPPPPSVPPAQIKVRVLDGAGKGLAEDTLTKLVQNGFEPDGYGVAPFHALYTEIHYAPDHLGQAKVLSDYVGAKLVKDPSVGDTVELVIGDIFPGLTVNPTATTLPPVPVSSIAPQVVKKPAHVPSTTTTTAAPVPACA